NASVDDTSGRPGARDRQHHMEIRALARSAFDADLPIALPDDSVRRGEPQASAAPDRLRREIRIDNAGDRGRVHADAGVRSTPERVATRAGLQLLRPPA